MNNTNKIERRDEIDKRIKTLQNEIKELETEKSNIKCQCEYTPAYSNMCKADAINFIDGRYYCKSHRDIYCSCGKKAVQECNHTYSIAVCGRPNCGSKECACKH